MFARNPWRGSFPLLLACLALLHLNTSVEAQIFNGGDVVAMPTGAGIIASDILPATFLTSPPKATGSSNDSKHGSSSSTNTTTVAPVPTVPPPPIPVQPYTTMGEGIFSGSAASPLPLPTTPALFPQNITTCRTCYGMFPTLSRCNAVANTNTFPITANTTFASLLPFLKCICTFKVLDAYPYCIDCFTKTQQLGQLNVLQANHLENYMDAFQQMCGATYNGNKIPDKSGALTLSGSWSVVMVMAAIFTGVASIEPVSFI